MSKELLHQHLHTAGTVVAAGESPAKGEYGGGGGGVVRRGSAVCARQCALCWAREWEGCG